MNKMKNFSYVVLFVVLMSCGGNTNSNNQNENDLQALKDEVMAVHDEVMPMMGDLRSTRMKLTAFADSLANVDSVQALNYSGIAAEIETANEGMMQWMREYEPEFSGSEQEIRDYLENQKELINKVKEDMNNSLAKGKEALSN